MISICTQQLEDFFIHGMDGQVITGLCTLQVVPFYYTKVFSVDTSYILCEKHGNLWFFYDGYTFLKTWVSHLCHCNNKIVNYSTCLDQAHNKFMLCREGSQGFVLTFKSCIIYYKGPHICDFPLEALILQCGGMIFTSSF